MEKSIDDQIKRWRKQARRCGKTAAKLYKALDGKKVEPEIELIIQASLAATFYAAARDAAYFGNVPEVD
jgi:hypothetical protein